MKIFTVFAFVLLTLIVLPIVSALSLEGNILGTIVYEPGKLIVNEYAITNTDKPVEVFLSGDLLEYIQISNVSNNQFKMTIAFPERIISQGSYNFQLTVREIAEESTSGMGSLLSVSKRFTVEVYSNEKELAASLSAPSVNVGSPVNFQVGVSSRGYQNIDKVQAEITVYNAQNETVGKVSTRSKPLPALGSTTLTATFPTENLLAGEYRAEALVAYDGKQKTASAAFRIGIMDLIINSYTTILRRGFSEFTINATNNWGNELRNVYAKVFLQDQELLQTPTISMAPWEKGKLKGLIKVDLPIGSYPGKIQLFYESEMKEEIIYVWVIEPEAPKQVSGTTSWRGISLIVLAVLVILLASLLIWKYFKKDEF